MSKAAETIAVVSGKGGVGKTMFSANMGAILAQRNKKVVIVDLDAGLRNMDIALGVENKVIYDIVDVLEGVCRVKQALVKDKRFPELYIMTSPQMKEHYELTPAHIRVLCRRLKEQFDYIILDAPAGIRDGFLSAISAADRVVIITAPELAAIRDADVVNKLLESKGIKEKKLVVNRVRMDLIERGLLPDIGDVAEMIRIEISGIIPDDENIYIASNNGFPIVIKKGSYIEQNFAQITDRILGTDMEI